MKKLTLSDVNKKQLRILAYLVGSGLLGYVLATYIAKDEMLTMVFAPALNWLAYTIGEELKKEGYAQVIRNK